MHDINDLLELIKEVAINAVRSEEPMGMDHGVVKKLDPLVIDLGDYTVEDDFIIITGRIRELIDKDKLHVGDTVLCIKDQGGDDWTIMDTVEADDDD